MQVRYNITGARRKEMVKAVSKALGDMGEIKYLGAPTFSYQVWCFEITKDGTLVFSDYTYPNIVENVQDMLKKEGFEIENGAEREFSGMTKADGKYVKEEPMRLSISLPRENFSETALKNLDNLLKSKGSLIKKAFGINETGVILSYDLTDEAIIFNWLEGEITAETSRAFQDFISKLCEMARTQKRVTAKPQEYINEKYAFRCFLLRLGFIGDEYKTSRKILLKNLSGNSSWRDGRRRNDEVSKQSGN